MKAIRNSFVLIIVLLLCSCDRSDMVGEPVAQKIYGKMGYHSIMEYRYMPYTADSVVLMMHVEEIESSIRHYNKASIYLGADMVAGSDSVPFVAEIRIPIMDDSLFQIKHVCWIDSLASYNDTLIHNIYVHKNEVVNPQPDTVSIIRERLDSVVLKTYYLDPHYFWWM